jgi:amino acid transporter
MGRHGVVHSSIGHAHEDNKTPYIAITISAILTFIVPAILLALGGGLFDIYGWVGTIATFGFLLNYTLIAIAAPIYLKREKELKPSGVILAVVTVAILLIPLLGSVYPLPALPYGAFPFIFLAWIIIGGLWYFIRRASTDVVSDINEDLDNVHSHFKDVRVNEGGEYI